MLVAYYRVSTVRQGQSGLGLEAQEAAIASYAERNGETVLRGFTEVESGRRCNRPVLQEAITFAQATGATLAVAKLDRLARNVAFLSRLMEAKVAFVACDNPHANRLTIYILAAVAEYELEMISARIKGALAARRARGLAWHGTPKNLTDAHRATGRVVARAARRANAGRHRSAMRPVAERLRAEGETLSAVAAAMNKSGLTTRRGRPWTLATVHVLLTPYPWEMPS